MRHPRRSSLAFLFAPWMAAVAALPGFAVEPGQPVEVAILELKVVEGDGAVHVAGSRSSLPLTVQVTDETGRPVEGATVSFQLPDQDPTGIFASGLSTEVLVTGPEGRASVRKIRWGHLPGPVRVRITAVKGKVRAGTISTQYIQSARAVTSRGARTRPPSVSKPRGKWIAIAVIAAGAAAAGLALGVTGSSSTPAAAAASSSQAPAVQVGAPTITIGNP